MKIYDKVIAKLFEEYYPFDTSKMLDDYKLLADTLIDYWKKNNKQPSYEYVRNTIVPRVCGEDKANRKRLTMILDNLDDDIYDSVSEIEDELHTNWVLKYVTDTLIKVSEIKDTKDIEQISSLIGQANSVLTKQTNVVDDNTSFVDTKDLTIKLIPTGFRLKDISKIPSGSLISILGLSGNGKSILAGYSALEVFFNYNQNVVYYSYELDSLTLKARWLSKVANVPYTECLTKKFESDLNRERVDKARYMFIKECKLEDINKYSLEEIKQLPNRKNKLKIRAVPSKQEFDLARQNKKSIPPMPNDKELLKELDTLSEYDSIYIDAIYLVPLSRANSREEGITWLAKELKQNALINSFNIYILNQSAGSKDSQLVPKYSREIHQSADMMVAIVNADKMWGMNEDSQRYYKGIVTVKHRHGKSDKVYPFIPFYENMDLVWENDVECPLWEFEKEEWK